MASGASSTFWPTSAPTGSPAVRHLGKPEPAYRKLTFRKDRPRKDQHLARRPRRPRPSALRRRGRAPQRETCPARRRHGLSSLTATPSRPTGCISSSSPSAARTPRANPQTLFGEVVAVRENLSIPHGSREAGSRKPLPVVSADCLLDLPAFPNPPASLPAARPQARPRIS